jgi:hypothetical protein
MRMLEAIYGLKIQVIGDSVIPSKELIQLDNIRV